MTQIYDDPETISFLTPEFHPSHIVIHHSLTKDGKEVNWEAIKKFHMEVNGWSSIGYHWGVELVGYAYKIMEGRSMLRPGAHVKGFNNKSIGVCMVGNFDSMPVPWPQWNLTHQLVRKLQRVLHIPTENVLGHWEAQRFIGVEPEMRKSCPGRLCNMDEFRRELQDGIT